MCYTGVGVGPILQAAQREKAGHVAGFWGPRGPREPRNPCAHSHLVFLRPLNVQAPCGHRAHGVMQTCGALAQLLGCCPGSIVAVLVTLMGGMLAAAASGHEGRPGPSGAIFSRLGEAGCRGLSGVTGSGCCVALGVAQAGTEGEGTQHSGSKPRSGDHLPVASQITGRFGRELYHRGHRRS